MTYVCTGRCCVLPETVGHTSNRDPECTIQGGASAVHALQSLDIQDSHIIICCGIRWKVGPRLPKNGSAFSTIHRIVASLVRAQPLPFLLNILKWLLVAIPATWTNSQLNYVQSKLALAYRTRLTKAIMGTYLGHDEVNDKVFYKLGTSLKSSPMRFDAHFGSVANLDDRIKNPDQYVRIYVLWIDCLHSRTE